MWSPYEFATMIPPTSLGVLLCSLLLGWRILSPSRQERALAPLARPSSTLPVLGNTLDIMFKHRHDLHDWILRESRRVEGGPWAFTLLGRPPAVILTSVDSFEDVLRRQFDRFGKCSATLVGDVFGDGIFAADGVQWLHQRKTASHLFSLHMMRDAMEEVVREQAAALCATLATHCTTIEASDSLSSADHKGVPINLKYTMDWYATNVFTRIGFGVDLSSLPNQQHDAFFSAFTRLPMAIHRRAQQPAWLWKMKRALNMGYERQLRHDMKLVDSIIYQVISQSMASKEADTKNQQHLPDLISLFLAKQDAEYGGADASGGSGATPTRVDTTPKLIRDMAFNFTAAGRGTSSQSLQWFFVMMNRYPSVEQKIRDELLVNLPRLFQTNENGNAPPTMNEVQQLMYLEATIKESLRLNPVAPLIGRITMQDATLSDGTFIAAGTRVVIPTFAVARLQSIWGEDAAEFKPERWIDPETGKLRTVSPYQFIVFLAGPRACLGAKLAMLELKVALASVISKFHLRVTRDPSQIGYAASLSLPIKGDVFATAIDQFAVDNEMHLGWKCSCDWIRPLHFRREGGCVCTINQSYGVNKSLAVLQESDAARNFLDALVFAGEHLKPLWSGGVGHHAKFVPLVCPLMIKTNPLHSSKAAVTRAMNSLHRGAGSRFFYKFQDKKKWKWNSADDYVETHWDGISSSTCQYCELTKNAHQHREEYEMIRANCQKLYRPLKAAMEKELQYVRYIPKPRLPRTRRYGDYTTQFTGLQAPYRLAIQVHRVLAGPRACLGAKLVMLKLKVALASVISKFHLRVTRDPSQIGYAASLALSIKEPVYKKHPATRKRRSRYPKQPKKKCHKVSPPLEDPTVSQFCYVVELSTDAISGYLGPADVVNLLQACPVGFSQEFMNALVLQAIDQFAVDNEMHLGWECDCDWIRSPDFCRFSRSKCPKDQPFGVNKSLPLLQEPTAAHNILEALLFAQEHLKPLCSGSKRYNTDFILLVCPLVMTGTTPRHLNSKAAVTRAMNSLHPGAGSRFFYKFQSKKTKGNVALDNLRDHWEGMDSSTCEHCESTKKHARDPISRSAYVMVRAKCQKLYRPLKAAMEKELQYVRFVPKPRCQRKMRGYDFFNRFDGLVAGVAKGGVLCGLYMV
ncbi:hypothetical protein BBJ28_00002133 [Nothophytophthora sp. Chile5]|nr:hypothetical protein BBJ28_00002133 [Nothophytophthora sp. Chile5]